MGRVRDRETYHPYGVAKRTLAGTTTIYENNVSPYFALVDKDYCEDVVDSPGVDHPLRIDHFRNFISTLNGQNGTPPNVAVYGNWQIPGFPSRSHVTVPDLPSIGVSATELLAKTNPGRAEVSLPVFIAEARDLPHAVKSIKDIGDQLKRLKVPRTRDVAGQLLSWEFGWRPLLSDLRKIVAFGDAVAKRTQEIERLYSKRGLKRRLTLFEGSAKSQVNLFPESRLGTLVAVREERHTIVRRWGTVRWRPTAMPPKGPHGFERQAIQAVFGLSLQAEDVWNVIPWTWLIDWTSNVGDYLAAHANRIPVAPTVPNIMTQRTTEIKWTRTNSNWIRGGEGVASYETKERALNFGTVEAYLPFLSSRQLSILGSLAITRFKGSWRF